MPRRPPSQPCQQRTATSPAAPAGQRAVTLAAGYGAVLSAKLARRAAGDLKSAPHGSPWAPPPPSTRTDSSSTPALCDLRATGRCDVLTGVTARGNDRPQFMSATRPIYDAGQVAAQRGEHGRNEHHEQHGAIATNTANIVANTAASRSSTLSSWRPAAERHSWEPWRQPTCRGRTSISIERQLLAHLLTDSSTSPCRSSDTPVVRATRATQAPTRRWRTLHRVQIRQRHCPLSASARSPPAPFRTWPSLRAGLLR